MSLTRSEADRERRRPDAVGRALATVTWAVIALCALAHDVLGQASRSAAQTVLVYSLGVFFAVVIVRVTRAAVVDAPRRGATLLLLASIGLWAAGSIVVNLNARADLTRFPAPGEWFFVLAYVGMAAYLVIGAGRPSQQGKRLWLDVMVVCGGTVCLAGVVLLMPTATSLGNRGPGLLLALLYPLLDVALALLVVTQFMIRARTDVWHTVRLVLGFVALAYADAHIVMHVSGGAYHFSALDDVTWGIAFAFIAGSACRPADALLRAVPRAMGSTLVVSASAVALALLVLRPPGSFGTYLAVPAVITLLAAGARLVLAVRQANGAAEAVELACTDDLTRLPNRRAMRIRLEDRFEAGTALGLVLLDLDGFKDINDTLGHSAGDTVLQLTAVQIRDAMPADMLVARLGGDEFAVVIDSANEIELLEIARIVQRELSKPLLIEGIELRARASIGVAAGTDDVRDSSELLRRADVAMYQAKIERAAPVLYDAHMDTFSRPRLRLAEDLRRGIPGGQLRLHYQPQVDATTRAVCGVEALVRWQHPTQGLLSPVEFLPAARRAGLMSMLSEEVARIAVTDLSAWLAAGVDLRLAINCAPPELMSGVFLTRLDGLLERHPECSRNLVVELTEDSFINEPERARDLILGMRERDLQIAIDDYGTGFSSLAYLRDLPVQELKIDRSFTAALLADHRTRMIVSSTIQMAGALDMRTVAEGVEDAATAAQLVAMGVDVLQGYYLARPMPADALTSWLVAHSAEDGLVQVGAREAAALAGRRNAKRTRVPSDRTTRAAWTTGGA